MRSAKIKIPKATHRLLPDGSTVPIKKRRKKYRKYEVIRPLADIMTEAARHYPQPGKASVGSRTSEPEVADGAHVENYLTLTATAISALADSMSELEKRLGRILRPAPEAEPAKAEGAMAGVAPLAGDIFALHGCLVAARARIHGIIDRLDL